MKVFQPSFPKKALLVTNKGYVVQFILGENFLFLFFCIHNAIKHTKQQRKIKIVPRIKHYPYPPHGVGGGGGGGGRGVIQNSKGEGVL